MKPFDFKKANSLAPGQYDLPTRAELNRIGRGSYVRICVAGDYLWTLVQSVYRDTVNAIADDTVHAVKCGDWLTFGKGNIAQVL